MPETTLERSPDLRPGMPEKLGPLHKTVIALKAAGLQNKEIAPIVGIQREYVSKIIHHPDAKPLLAQMTADHVAGIVDDVGSAIKASAMEAFLTVQDLMRNAKKDEVRRDCAFDILNRAGFTAKTNSAPPPVKFGESGVEKIVTALNDTQRALKPLREVQTAKEVLEGEGGVLVEDLGR